MSNNFPTGVKAMEKTDKNVSKQAYHVPQVQDYGNVKAITNTISSTGNSDNSARGATLRKSGVV
jgi:hypothetical protein